MNGYITNPITCHNGLQRQNATGHQRSNTVKTKCVSWHNNNNNNNNNNIIITIIIKTITIIITIITTIITIIIITKQIIMTAITIITTIIIIIMKAPLKPFDLSHQTPLFTSPHPTPSLLQLPGSCFSPSLKYSFSSSLSITCSLAFCFEQWRMASARFRGDTPHL